MANSSLEIITLGKFLVFKDEHIISEHKTKTSKIWELFQYFLSKSNEINSPEQIIKDLEFNMELMDAKNALENRIYRLRKVLAVEEDYIADQYIYYKNGGYGLRWNNYNWIDFKAFQNDCENGEKLVRAGKKLDAIECFLSALNLYQGDYLNNQLNPHWIIAPRVQYRQLYLESLNQVCQLLAEFEEYQKIEELCRRAVQIEPFEEHPHYILIKTLIKRGHRRKAHQHYSFVQTLFARQGVELYPELGKILSQSAQSQSRLNRGVFNLDQIKEELNLDNTSKGVKVIPAQICHDFAEYLYKRSQRDNEKLYLASVTLEFCRSYFTEEEEKSHINTLQKTLKQNLRDSDIICEWSGQQYLILLTSIQEEKVIEILERIKNKYYENEEYTGTIINTSYRIL